MKTLINISFFILIFSSGTLRSQNQPESMEVDILTEDGIIISASYQYLKDPLIDSKRIGILGASIGGNLAVVAASMEKYPIKSAVSISAKTSAVQNLSGMKEPVNPKNVFYIASEGEQNSLREKWAYELYDTTTGYKKIKIAKGDKHGSYILIESKSQKNSIIEWFKKTL